MVCYYYWYHINDFFTILLNKTILSGNVFNPLTAKLFNPFTAELKRHKLPER